ncbi:MAG: GGDEF domain-containing protein [Oscillospiraceae bacterium]
MQNLLSTINVLILPFFVLVILTVDYQRVQETDPVQKRLFTKIVAFSIAGMAAELIWRTLPANSGGWLQLALYAALLLFYWLQISAISITFVLLDYIVYRNEERTKKMDIFNSVFMLLCILVLLGNLSWSYYSNPQPGGAYVQGAACAIHIAVAFFPVICILVDLLLALTYSSGRMLSHLFVFVLPISISIVVDLFCQSSLAWASLVMEILYVYLFILRQDADKDPLTKLKNRRSLDSYLKEIGKEDRKDFYSFIMLDLNQFKEVNDKYGHFEGDKALRNFAEVINSSVRHIDFAARFGGDEFCIIAKGLSNPDRLVERMQSNLNQYNRSSQAKYDIAFSYGSDLYRPGDPRTSREFLNHVDNLLYENKKQKPTSLII